MVTGDMEKQGYISEAGSYDQEIKIGPISALFTQGQPRHRQAPQPGNIQDARSRKAPRERSAVFQAALTQPLRVVLSNRLAQMGRAHRSKPERQVLEMLD